jgi:phosphoglycolate phosphatase
MKRRHDLVLFDFDGTICDSALGIVRCWQHAFDALGVPMPPNPNSMIGPPLRIMFTNGGMPDHLADEAVVIYRERYDTLGVLEAELYEGVVDMLDTVAEHGYRLAIATSKQEPAARRMLDHFELTDRFEYIGGATRDGRRSAKADVIEYVLENLPGWEATRTMMIGDRYHDVTGAAAHGIECIGVLWGYGDADELSTAGAVSLVDHPAHIVRAMQ